MWLRMVVGSWAKLDEQVIGLAVLWLLDDWFWVWLCGFEDWIVGWIDWFAAVRVQFFVNSSFEWKSVVGGMKEETIEMLLLPLVLPPAVTLPPPKLGGGGIIDFVLFALKPVTFWYHTFRLRSFGFDLPDLACAFPLNPNQPSPLASSSCISTFNPHHLQFDRPLTFF